MYIPDIVASTVHFFGLFELGEFWFFFFRDMLGFNLTEGQTEGLYPLEL